MVPNRTIRGPDADFGRILHQQGVTAKVTGWGLQDGAVPAVELRQAQAQIQIQIQIQILARAGPGHPRGVLGPQGAPVSSSAGNSCSAPGRRSAPLRRNTRPRPE